MLRVELIPDLSHCIETVTRREHAETTKQLLGEGKEQEQLKEKIQLLEAFRETADFRALRRESEKHLIEGRQVKFVVQNPFIFVPFVILTIKSCFFAQNILTILC